ncbi:MAG: redoxin domain-containing protein [Deltaproteobacteria bacterium]|nr:MAG: redoxin domain-containing protein [Deltaproteobacteria bacterium]
MRQRRVLIGLFWLLVSVFAGLPHLRGQEIQAGTSWLNLSQLELQAPKSSEEREYLGLNDQTSFSLAQIPTKLILIECLNLYCPSCHEQANVANSLHDLIREDPNLSKEIKVIGICAGNNVHETKVYKDDLVIRFPLFPDPDFVVHEKFGSPRTPFTLLLNNRGEVLFIHYGIVKKLDDFFCSLRQFYKRECHPDSPKKNCAKSNCRALSPQ